MSIRKLLSALLCTTLCITTAFAESQAESDAQVAATTAAIATPADWKLPQSAEGPKLYGAHAALLCTNTGQILLGKEMDAPVPPASITKVMTALVVLEHCEDLSVKTTVSKTAVNSIEWNSTHIGLKAGEVVTLEQMMGAMLIQSANDAANVLAEYVGGSLEGFAEMMTERAAELGCKNTHFVNANGLDDPQHYTSAHDMALIGQTVVKYPAFAQFAGAMEYTIPPTNLCPTPRTFYTKQNILCHNPQQYYYAGAFAGKNGWTTKARQTLITFAKRNEVTLVAVTMKSDSRYNKVLDTIAMFNYGFQNFSMQKIPAEMQQKSVEGVIENCDTAALKDTPVFLPNGVTTQQLKLTPQDGDTPEITVSLDGEKLIEIPVPEKAAETVKTIAQDGGKGTFSLTCILVIVVGAVFGVFALLVGYRLMRIRKQRRFLRQRHQRAAKFRSNTGKTQNSDRFGDSDWK